MRARVHALLPFKLTVPEGSQFTSEPYDIDGYTVIDRPPQKSDRIWTVDADTTFVTVNGVKAFDADVLVVDFHKEEFNRARNSQLDKERTNDPSHEIINETLNNQLRRIRYAGREFAVQPIEFPSCGGQLEYTDDDGNELPEQPGLVRKILSRNFSFSFNLCTSEVWSNAQSLPPNFQPPTWDDIRLDAQHALPHIGTAIVLSAVALETFINQIVENLGSKNTDPPGVWAYVTNRSDWYQLPSVEDNFDTMLKLFTGHSLKDEPDLWLAFTEIKNARSQFVHHGVARIGKKGPIVTLPKATNLVGMMNQIIDKVRTWLPEEMRWPSYTYQNQVEIRSLIGRFKAEDAPLEPAEVVPETPKP